jgi:NAD(P)-dependent dehydrogenase (short-subunit alcohol dehydrogenase family)
MEITNLPLDGRVAIVTGSRLGIGKEIARSLAIAGAAVVLNGSSDEGKDDLLDEFREISPHVRFVRADVSERGKAQKLVEMAVGEFGFVDIHINNAGVNKGCLLGDFPEETWQKIFDVNLTGALFCIQEVLPIMREKRRGDIINISTTAAFDLPLYTGAYGISKVCLGGLTKILAREEARHGIRVNALAPSYIPTRMVELEDEDMSEKLRRKVLSRTPLGRLGRPEDVARAVLFLVSPRGKAITGEIFRISGGLQMPL